jgi:DNA (cytosine-5)-methyltransferase 1
MAGDKSGINGTKSNVFDELLRLLKKSRPNWAIIENVYFMLHLGNGAGMEHVLSGLERLGYKWAYRIVDTRAFGLPQRRRRVFILACLEGDPRVVLLGDDEPELEWPKPDIARPIGFYWTEGRSGHGLTGNAIPPLKAGSGVGIPSPPAVLLPSLRVVKPSIEAAEMLQGFPKRWTSPIRGKKNARQRWRLVGNAVSVPVAEWIGKRLCAPAEYDDGEDRLLERGSSWPSAAWNLGGGRRVSRVSAYPVNRRRGTLLAYALDDWPDLSEKALNGFVRRARDSKLKYPAGFLHALEHRV